MIKNKQEYLYYLEADRIGKSRAKTGHLVKTLKNLLFPDPIWNFQKTLRRYEYYKNCKLGLWNQMFMVLIALKFRRLSYKLGYTIPLNVFGPGLSIAHYGTIVINNGVTVGSNCRLHCCVNIGTEAGYVDKAPKIGDNCYIGPGAKIFGDICIADNIAIAANAVVNKSFEESNVAIGGIPAKKISDIEIFDIVIPATQIINDGLNSLDFSGMSAKTLREFLLKNRNGKLSNY